MKIISIKLLIAICILSSLIQNNVVLGQEGGDAGDFVEIFRGGPEDATKYLENYVAPGMLSFSNGMAAGWYNTAKTHKSLGLDLTFSLNVANMPLSQRQFAFNESDYMMLRLVSGNSSAQLPTLVGGGTNEVMEVRVGDTYTTNGITYEYVEGRQFEAARGFDVEDVPFVGVPVPTLQLGIGLFKNTDLKLRFIPKQEFDDYSVKLFGFGIMHDVKQWIPGIKQVPIDLSIFFGTTKMTSEFSFNRADVDYRTEGTAKFEASATTFPIVASKKISFFTPYIGVGINSVNTSLDVAGEYSMLRLLSNPLDDSSYFTSSDPINLDFTGGGGMRTTIGFRLKLFILTLHADYTIQKYSTLSVGLGFSFRQNT